MLQSYHISQNIGIYKSGGRLIQMQLLGLDIGTTTICAVVLDSASGTVLYSATLPNRSQVASNDDYAHVQDPIQIWETVSRLATGILNDYPTISGIGVSSQMHGILYVDKLGEPVSAFYTWQDGRGNLLHPQGSSYTEILQSITGYRVASGYGLVTHFYHVCTDTVPKRAACLCTIGDFVAMKLCDQARPIIDPTNAAGLGLFQRDAFDSEALFKANISLDIIPQVVPSGTKIGETASGVSVYAALGDNQASFLGAVPSPRGALLMNVGTGAQLSVWSDEAYTGEGWEARPFPGGGWLSVAATLGGGKTFALLEGFYREVCHWFAGVNLVSLYNRIDELLAEADVSADPLEVRPQFFGSRLNPIERGTIVNISGENFTPKALAQAWVVGMATEYHGLFEHLSPEIRASVTHVVGSGNGMHKNSALRTAIEQSFHLPLHLSLFDEEAALGAAICAGVGEGVFPGFMEAGRRLRKP